ncbi:PucR family transcriptional regulator [Streptomyces sp. NPDC018833]|uniref:PucR family transcriptional regulator n=1 Tax=Streptomyces sp. NPDC018833 TaxID=3365053 RepID=UPI00378A72A9
MVRELADAALAGLPALVQDVVELIWREEAAYHSESPVTKADLTDSVRVNMERMLHAFAGRSPEHPHVYDAPQATGRRRAEQHFPLEAVLHSYRLAMEAVWDRLLAESRIRGPEVREALLDHAARLWQVIDRYSVSVAEAYRARESDLARREEQRQDALLDALIQGHGRDPSVAAEAERVLGLPREGRYVVVCAGHGSVRARPTARSLRGHLAARHIRSVWRTELDRELGVVSLVGTSLPRIAALLSGQLEQPAGVSGAVAGLAEIGTAAHLAELALRTVPPGAVQTVVLDDRLPEALLVSAPQLAARLRRSMLGRVLDLPDDEGETLLATLRAWFHSGRSAARTAEAVHCHRNTVFNRLRRVEELTGHFLDDDRDELSYRLALAALLIQSDDRAERDR